MEDQLSLPRTAGPIFVAYASHPAQLGTCIEAAAKHLKERERLNIATWRQLDIPGRFLADRILEQIDAAAWVVADITRLNFNVTFEIGYALGTDKRVVLCMNESLDPQKKLITQLGVFDTLGWASYTNSDELAEQLLKVTDDEGLRYYRAPLNTAAPVYVLDTFYKTDASVRILARIKRAKIRYRSFDPKEQARLSALEAIKGVSSSVGVVVHLLSEHASDHLLNNLRGAFVAGLAYGYERELLLLQDGEGPVPLDFRDLVSVYYVPHDIDNHISKFAPTVTEALQQSRASALPPRDVLATIDFGAFAAENEIVQLGDYYLETDQYRQVLLGTVRLVVGRKGSGKTALFFQARDQLAEDRRNLVLDLKPEGHQFRRFKELVLAHVGQSVQEHITTVFWEYVLLLEMCRKLLELDEKRHLRDHRLFEPYKALQELYREDPDATEGDFSQRILTLVQRLTDDFGPMRKKGPAELDSAPIVALLYTHDVKELRAKLARYLEVRGAQTWTLLDNIDKGWPTRGIELADIVILRGLLEASRKIERHFSKVNVQSHTIVFLRNDVYELLIRETPDHGKETRVSMDWTDPDLLRELLRRRIVKTGDLDSGMLFDQAWAAVCESHVEGEASVEYLIGHSLMRPRNLLNLVIHARGNAVNLRHPRITSEDLQKAAGSYSADVVNELSLEIRDVFPAAGDDILYFFLDAKPQMSLAEVRGILKDTPIPASEHERLLDILLWFSFFGVLRSPTSEIEDASYIYSVHYDMRKLKRLAKDFVDSTVRLAVHRAFWPALSIQ